MDRLIATIMGILAVAIIIGVVYIVRYASNMSTPITVHEVRPGIECAILVTSDGAAIDCWENDN